MNKEICSKEIQSRLESNQWSQKIADAVSNKYARNQAKNKIFYLVSAILLFGIVSVTTLFIEDEIMDPSLSEVETYRYFFIDDINPIYDTMVQEQSISSLIEPISYFVK